MDKLPKTSQHPPSSQAADSGGRAYWCLGGPVHVLSCPVNRGRRGGNWRRSVA